MNSGGREGNPCHVEECGACKLIDEKGFALWTRMVVMACSYFAIGVVPPLLPSMSFSFPRSTLMLLQDLTSCAHACAAAAVDAVVYAARVLSRSSFTDRFSLAIVLTGCLFAPWMLLLFCPGIIISPHRRSLRGHACAAGASAEKPPHRTKRTHAINRTTQTTVNGSSRTRVQPQLQMASICCIQS